MSACARASAPETLVAPPSGAPSGQPPEGLAILGLEISRAAFGRLSRLVAALCRLAPLALAAPLPARAQTAPQAPASQIDAICADRPTKSDYACTVPAGHVQYETDLVNESLITLGAGAETWMFLNPTLKYGVAPNADIEASMALDEDVRTPNVDGARSLNGIGDLYLRFKYGVLNAWGGALQAALAPYVKAPTARVGIGDGAAEGGMILPVNIKLNDDLMLTTAPELDALKNSSGDGRHANLIQTLNLAVSLPQSVTVFGEAWGDWNFDPAGQTRQFSADTGVAFGVTPNLQLDAGANFGLNRQTPRVQAYVGISQRF